jgi:dTDP-4-amino-4,6-dideoxygalactose transaminase
LVVPAFRLGVAMNRSIESCLEPNLYKYIVIVPRLRDEKANHKLYRFMQDYGIGLQAKCNSKPLHKMKVYDDKIITPWWYKSEWQHAESEQYCMSHICLPIYPTLGADNATYVLDRFLEVISCLPD